MGITKTWDSKNKCWHLSKTAKDVKKLAGLFLTGLGPAGWIAKSVGKEIMRQKMRKKKYCEEDIKWAMKNI